MANDFFKRRPNGHFRMSFRSCLWSASKVLDLYSWVPLGATAQHIEGVQSPVAPYGRQFNFVRFFAGLSKFCFLEMANDHFINEILWCSPCCVYIVLACIHCTALFDHAFEVSARYLTCTAECRSEQLLNTLRGCRALYLHMEGNLILLDSFAELSKFRCSNINFPIKLVHNFNFFHLS